MRNSIRVLVVQVERNQSGVARLTVAETGTGRQGTYYMHEQELSTVLAGGPADVRIDIDRELVTWTSPMMGAEESSVSPEV